VKAVFPKMQVFRLTAQVLDFPRKPGDIGLFLIWENDAELRPPAFANIAAL